MRPSKPASAALQRRAEAVRSLDDEIGRAIQDAADSGELRKAPGYGQPTPALDAYRETPQEFRLAFKLLKDSGHVPPEIETLREAAALQAQLDALPPDDPARPALAGRIQDLRLQVSLRLEAMRATGSI